jgi:hypothetical protein
MRIVGELETLPEAGAECTVVDGAADLVRQGGAARDQRICCTLTMRWSARKLAVPSVSNVPTATRSVFGPGS